ncbi:hypothetical protein [Macrococcus equi]|uniref:hypothetical protein n=1 Tax=Macrococcus equi TaxID=3395462 RepID=UPI0039BEC69B
MKKSMKILLAISSVLLILSGCGDGVNKEKGASKIESNNQNNNIKMEKESTRINTDDFDIATEKFKKEFLKDYGKGFRGIEPGMSYAEVKSKLGKPTELNSNYGIALGGLQVHFNNFILIFKDVNSKNKLNDKSIVENVILKNKKSVSLENFSKVWGVSTAFNGIESASIGSLTYDIDGMKIYALKNHGDIDFITKDNLKEIADKNITKYASGNNNITMVNGVSHYNVPDLLSKSFADSIKENTFNIDGFGLLKSTNKDPYNDLKPIEAESGEGLAVYDNFILHLKSGTGKTPKYPVNQIDILDLSSQNVTIDELLEKWNISSDKLAFLGGSFDIYNLDNGTYITFKYDIDSKIIDEINLNEGTFSEGAPPSDIEDTDSTDDSNEAQLNAPNIDFRNGTSYYNFPDITNFDFAYQVCTAAFKINGIGLGDTPDLEPLGEYHENEVIYEYGNFGFEMIGDRVNGIKLHVADQNVQIDTLEKAWKSKVDIRKKNSIFYDNDKTNGFLVRVDFDDDGVVQDIFILGVNI